MNKQKKSRGYTLFDNGAVRLFILDCDIDEFLIAVLYGDMLKACELSILIQKPNGDFESSKNQSIRYESDLTFYCHRKQVQENRRSCHGRSDRHC